MDIYIDDRYDGEFIDDLEEIINKSAKMVIEHEEFDLDVEISVSIVDNNEIRQINKEFRGIDKETDVLSFPLLEYDENGNYISEDFSEDDENILLGDIIISWDKVISQAEEYGHGLERELGFLVVHSMLHLLGYDHEEPEQEKEMFALQDVILNKIGLMRWGSFEK